MWWLDLERREVEMVRHSGAFGGSERLIIW